MVCCLSLYGGYGCTVRRRVFGVLRQSGQVAARAWTFAYRGRIETDGSTEFPQAGCALEEGRCSGYRSAVRRLFAYSQPYCRKVELTGKLPKTLQKLPRISSVFFQNSHRIGLLYKKLPKTLHRWNDVLPSVFFCSTLHHRKQKKHSGGAL